MQRLLYALFASALAAAPATLAAQTQEPARSEARGAMHRFDPVARLLARKAELGLSADQVARLEAVQAKMQERNRPLVEKLRAARAEFRGDGEARPRELTPGQREELRKRWESMTPEQREERRKQREERRAEMRKRMEEIRPVVEQLRENHRQAMTEARAVLTAEQQARLEELRGRRAGERGGDPHRRGPRDGGPHGRHR